jgi:hypothetical protein
MLESRWCGVVLRQEGYAYRSRVSEVKRGSAAGCLTDWQCQFRYVLYAELFAMWASWLTVSITICSVG